MKRKQAYIQKNLVPSPMTNKSLKSPSTRSPQVLSDLEETVNPELNRNSQNSSHRKQNRSNILYFPNPRLSATPNTNPLYLKHLKYKWIVNKLLSKAMFLSPMHVVRDQKNAKEEWLRRREDQEDYEITSRWLILRSTSLFSIIQLIMLVIYVWLSWLLSLKFVIKEQLPQQLNQTCFQVCLISFLVDSLLNLNTQKVYSDKSIKNRKVIFFKYVRTQLWFDLVSLASAVGVAYSTSNILVLGGKLVLPCFFITSYRVILKYRNAETYLEGIFGVWTLKLLNSFFMLLTIGHLTSLLLYASASLDPVYNWIQRLELLERNWHTDYICSLYWAFTIITTVGFGDITPTNNSQRLIVIFSQILGSSLFGYMISVIGMTLTEMKQLPNQFPQQKRIINIDQYHLYQIVLYLSLSLLEVASIFYWHLEYFFLFLKKDKEQLENNIKIADKLINCLGLDQSLSYRLKCFLKDNQKVDSSFSMAEQSHILSRLSPALKYQIMKVTNFRVVSKCTFLLTYFNRRFLDEISLKLTKHVFQPGEQLLQNPSECDMFIVGSGHIDIQYRMIHKSSSVYRKVGAIQKYGQHEIGSNLYGYVAAVVNRPLRLNAVSRSFTLVYRLRQADFLEIVNNWAVNYEIMCELRDRFFGVRLPESIQGPLLIDPACHYVANIHILTKRQQINTTKQKRVEIIRHRHASVKALIVTKSSTKTYMRLQAMRISQSHNLLAPFKAQISHFLMQVQRQENLSVPDNFQQVRVFENFMKNFNCNIVLQRYRYLQEALNRVQLKAKSRLSYRS